MIVRLNRICGIFLKDLKYIHFESPYYQVNYNFPRLPDGITHLIFGYYFNKSIPNFPDTLLHIEFGYSFCQKIPRLPNNLLYLKIGTSFDETQIQLPCNLRYFNVNFDFLRKDLSTLIFPKKLTHLIWNVCTKISTSCTDITHLKLCNYHDISQLFNLRHLVLDRSHEHKLPPNVEYLKLDNRCHHITYLPSNLKRLILHDRYQSTLPELPSGLIQLICGKGYNKELSLPDSLQYLTLNRSFDKKLLTLPLQLTHLSWYCYHKPPVLPNTIIYFAFGCITQLHKKKSRKKDYWYHRLQNDIKYMIFPDKLKHLIWYYDYDLPSLPNSIEYITLGPLFNKQICALPSGIREIRISHKFKYIDDLKIKYKDILHIV